MTEHITPQEARDALARWEPYTHDNTEGLLLSEVLDSGECIDALETIAAMRPEYQYQYPGADTTVSNELGIWHSLPELAHAYRPFTAWLEGRNPDDERGSVITRYVLDPDQSS